MSWAAGGIQHTSAGCGHPYRIDPDQRHPVQLVGGDPFELRALTDPTVAAVTVELDDGSAVPMQRVTLDDLYDDVGVDPGDGHLAAASGSRPDIGCAQPWRVRLTAPPRGVVGYRFVAAGCSTERFLAPVGVWGDVGGELSLVGDGGHGDARVSATDWLVTDDGVVGVRVALALAAGERVVGFGERFDSVDQRGRVLDTTVFEQYKQQGNRTYLPSPFAIVAGGERGWGFHVRTSRRVHFDVGHQTADRLLIELAVDPARPVVELRLYEGDPRLVLATHLAEVGGLRRPPDWVFRPWMSANDWNTQARVEAEVARSVELGVPVGAVVIEAWSDESTFAVFRDARYDVRPDGAPLAAADVTYPPDGAWPDPAGMIRRLGERDVRVLLWQIPVLPSGDDEGHRRDGGQLAADAATMTARGYCVGEADGTPYRNRGWWFPGALLPDWTNPAATQWWLAKRRYLVDELGVAGFKTDGGEHAWGDELTYADGTRGAESNNRFPLAYAEAYSSLFDDGEGTVFSRAGFTGAGRAPCHWAGDEDSTWPAFRASITAGLSAAVSGVAFWGWDLAGFSGELPTVELYVRAAAMAALCPIMQYHSEFTGNLADADGRRPQRDRTPWNVAEQRGDQRALTLYRRFAVLRERLQPYLRAQADVCVDERVPMMRPLGLGWPTDRAVWEHPLQYQFGDSMLVAPVCDEGATGVDVYLPEGAWIDAWSGEERRGPRLVRRPVPWDEIAVYLTADAAASLLPLFRDLPDPLPPDPEDFHKQNRADLHDFAPQNRDGGR